METKRRMYDHFDSVVAWVDYSNWPGWLELWLVEEKVNETTPWLKWGDMAERVGKRMGMRQVKKSES